MDAPLNGVWWTLSVELGFYFCCHRWVGGGALELAIAARGGSGYYSGLALLGFSTAQVESCVAILPLLDSLLGTLFTFMLGLSLNFFPAARRPLQRRAVLIVGAVMLLMLQWQLRMNEVYWSGHWILVVWPPLVALAIAVLVYHLRELTVALRWLASPALLWLGRVSFGIYLWHFQVMRILALLFPDARGGAAQSLISSLIAVPATLSLAALSFYLIERPLMGLCKKTMAGVQY